MRVVFASKGRVDFQMVIIKTVPALVVVLLFLTHAGNKNEQLFFFRNILQDCHINSCTSNAKKNKKFVQNFHFMISSKAKKHQAFLNLFLIPVIIVKN